MTSVNVPAHAFVFNSNIKLPFDGISLNYFKFIYIIFVLFLKIYCGTLIVPPSQWKRGGTVFHANANNTISAASNTPKPNKWLYSNPTPFISLNFFKNNQIN